jgi:DNA-binding IclR family transcriptional regulator
MTWRYDKEREKVLEVLYQLANSGHEQIGFSSISAATGKSASELRSILKDLEKAGFIETLDRKSRCRLTEEGKLRLMKA